jgi:hypothetical protein
MYRESLLPRAIKVVVKRRRLNKLGEAHGSKVFTNLKHKRPLNSSGGRLACD